MQAENGRPACLALGSLPRHQRQLRYCLGEQLLPHQDCSAGGELWPGVRNLCFGGSHGLVSGSPLAVWSLCQVRKTVLNGPLWWLQGEPGCPSRRVTRGHVCFPVSASDLQAASPSQTPHRGFSRSQEIISRLPLNPRNPFGCCLSQIIISPPL